MSEQRYSIAAAIRSKYKVFPISAADLRKFSNLSLELFTYLKDVKKIDFKIYFRVDLELIEFLTPQNFGQEQIDMIIAARSKDDSSLEICVERKDYPRFELLIKEVRDKKISRLLEQDPLLDRQTIMTFADLSSASQMIVRGGINKNVAARAKESAGRLIDNLMESHVAIGTLSRMILADGTLYDHSAAVAMIAGIMAKNMLGKSKSEAEKIARSGLYHDVGKTCVPGHILNKPGKFTPEEFEIIKTHTTLGYAELEKAIIAGAPIEAEVALVALEHHEKFNGTGYPLAKTGRAEERADGIHEYARIVTIADIYSALLMKRVYKEAYDQNQSLELMRGMAPTQFDPIVWENFETSVTASVDYYQAIEKHKKTEKGRILVFDDNGKLAQLNPPTKKSAS